MNLKTTTKSSQENSKSALNVTKKIDLGAAANFGKPSTLTGIHSPTHLESNVKPTVTNNNLIDDLFKTCPAPKSGSHDDFSDFDPRADTIAASGGGGDDFGDFESVFATPKTLQQPQELPSFPQSDNSENFADFQSAFDSAHATSFTSSDSTAPHSSNTFDLFGSTIPAGPAPVTSNIDNSSNADLLSGLSDLTISPNPAFNGGKF